MADRCKDMLMKLGTLSVPEANKVLKYIDELQANPRRAAIVGQKAADHELAAKVRTMQAQKTAEAFHNYEQGVVIPGKAAVKELNAKGKKARLYHVISGWMVGQNKEMLGNLNSIDSQMRGASGYATQYLLHMFADPEKGIGPGWQKLLKDDSFNRDLVREMGQEDTGNPQAKRMATIFNETFSAGIRRENAAGAHVQELDKYMFTQYHSPVKVGKMGETAWGNTIRPLLNESATFGGEDPNLVLHRIYNDIIKDTYKSTLNGKNIANALSSHRSLIFKNADAALAYHKMFGYGSVIDGLFRHTAMQQSKAVLMEHMGPNPAAFFERMKEGATDTESADGMQLSAHDVSNLERQFKALSGESNKIASYKIAAFGDMLRAFGGTLPKLGMSAIHSVGDTNNAAVMLQRMGYPIFPSYAKSVSAAVKWLFFRKAMDPEAMENLWSVGAGMHAQAQLHLNRFDYSPDVSEMTRRLKSLMFVFNRQLTWDDHIMFATGAAWMHKLAANAGKEFEDLNPRTRNMLFLTGFDKAAWDKLRTATQVKSGQYSYLPPDAIKDQELRTRYLGALYQFMSSSVPLPGARAHAFLQFGGERGTWHNEIASTLLMFKSFPLGVIQKMYPMAAGLYDHPAVGLAQYAAGATVLGYASLALSNMLIGREPPAPEKFTTYLESLAQGGAGSLYGDIIAPGKKPGEELTSLATGPVTGEAEDWLRFAKAAYGPGQASPLHKMGVAAVPLVRSDVPFANLWFTHLAWQYGVTYPMVNALDPGSVERLQDRAQQQYNDKFWLKAHP